MSHVESSNRVLNGVIENGLKSANDSHYREDPFELRRDYLAKAMPDPEKYRTRLDEIASWILDRQEEDGFIRSSFLWGKRNWAWYEVIFAARALLYAGRILDNTTYTNAAMRTIDLYRGQQFRSGAFPADHIWGIPEDHRDTSEKRELYCENGGGTANVADNGTNMIGLLQAADVYPSQRDKFIKPVHRWVNDWLPENIKADGHVFNGRWAGRKHEQPFTLAATECLKAICALGLVENDESHTPVVNRITQNLLEYWLPDGRPIHIGPYANPPALTKTAVEDYATTYYLLDALCWAFEYIKEDKLRQVISEKVNIFVFGPKGLLSWWYFNYFNIFPVSSGILETYGVAADSIAKETTAKFHVPWQIAKSCGVFAALKRLQTHVEPLVQVEPYIIRGLDFLCDPQASSHIGIMAHDQTSWGLCALTSGAYACLSLAEYIDPGINYRVVGSD